jgi:hypothetical protein
MDTISHNIDNDRDRRLRDCFEGYEAVKGAERYGDDLCVLRRAPHEDGTEEIFGLWSIYRVIDGVSDKV